MADNLYSYDSFAKLNIMSEVATDGSPVVPQIMFDLAKNGSKRTWNGDRLAITYNSGNAASVFRISEVTGTYRNKLNFELLGSNNIYYGTVKGTSNNSFIFSRNNSISDNSFDNNWINSDGNSLFATGTSGINFIDSNDNVLASGYLQHRFSSAANVSFYHSNNNRILPQFTYIKGVKGSVKGVISQPLYDNTGNITGYSLVSSYNGSNTYIKGVNGGVLRNKTLIDSDYNRFLGHDNTENNTTIINSDKGYYLNNLGSKNTVIIGNDWGYIKGVSANTIAIGRGLVNYNTSADKIILGQYNRNSTNDKEILIVGDGRLTDEYLNSLTAANPQWKTDDLQYGKVMSALLGTGSPSADDGLYRHNIFTVNKDGYITISDWSNPNNSARYGYNGLTSYIDGSVYTIPYKTLYNKINIGDAVTQMQETVDSYTKQMEDIIKTMPSNYFFTVPAGVKDVFLNYEQDATHQASTTMRYIWSAISANMENNTILGITFTPSNASDTLTAHWKCKCDDTVQELSAVISAYCAKQFLFTTTGNGPDGFTVSGFMKVND